jgi:hypothetical protein
MTETETRETPSRRPVRLVQVDAETLRQLRSDRDRYKSDRDDAWATLAAQPVLSRDVVTTAILGARDAGGNLIEYLSATTAGYLADAVLDLLGES